MQNGVQIKQLQSGRCLTVDNNPIRSIFTNFKPAIISSNCAPPLNALSLWQFNFTVMIRIFSFKLVKND